MWLIPIKSVFHERFVEMNPLIIMQGFIGTSLNGLPSILKKEGSDLSAAITAISLKSDLTFWKKRGIPGNPSQLSFEEFQKMEESSNGNKLLSPQALKLLIESSTTFGISNFDNLQKEFDNLKVEIERIKKTSNNKLKKNIYEKDYYCE